MRILFITEQFPYPLFDGGNLRTFHILKGLAQEHEVHLLSHAPTQGTPPAGTFDDLGSVVTVSKPNTLTRLTANSLRYGTSGYPLFILKNWSSSILSEADALLSQSSFDAIHFNHLDTACYALRRGWPHLKVFDSHNCLAALAKQVSGEQGSWLRRQVYAREARQLAEMEKTVCRQMDITLTCSEDDARALTELGSTGTHVVAPNGVDTTHFSPPTDEQPIEPSTLVFTGAMDYYPNEQAAIYFCQEVMPLLRRRRPDVKLYLVGKSPTQQVLRLHDDQNVFVTGRVDDVRPYVQKAAAVVVPLRHGSGTRLKILEAFSMGKAVVSTTRGVEGIPAQPGREILIADSPHAFDDQVQQLLDAPKLAARIGGAAREFVEARYDWEQIGRVVREAYGTMAAERIAHVA